MNHDRPIDVDAGKFRRLDAPAGVPDDMTSLSRRSCCLRDMQLDDFELSAPLLRVLLEAGIGHPRERCLKNSKTGGGY